MKQIAFDGQMNHSRMWKAWRSLILFYLATNPISLTVPRKPQINHPHPPPTSDKLPHWGGGSEWKNSKMLSDSRVLWWLGWGFCVVSCITDAKYLHSQGNRAINNTLAILEVFCLFCWLSPLLSGLGPVSCYFRFVSHGEASADWKP